MTELQKLQKWLAEAEQTLHELNLGKSVVAGSKNGRSFQFSAANRQDLVNYINELKDKIARIQGTPRRGPIEYVF